jgi:hypothetical protein
MDAEGNIRTVTPTSDPHTFRAMAVSVGRLGIMLEVSMRIVPNKAVRREKQDMTTEGFASAVQKLQEQYIAAKANGTNGPSSRAVWEVLKQWDEKQVGAFDNRLHRSPLLS